MAWTDEMVEELKKLWAEGVTTGEIGRRLNISKNSIVGKVHRLGLSGRPSPIKKKADESDPKPVATTPSAKEKNAKKPTQPKEVKTPVKTASAPKDEPHSEKKATPKPAPHSAPKQAATNDEEDIKLAKSINMPVVNSSKKDHLSLIDLDNHTCRWPVGDPKDDNFHFCGKKVRVGQTYCEEHAATAYVKPGKK